MKSNNSDFAYKNHEIRCKSNSIQDKSFEGNFYYFGKNTAIFGFMPYSIASKEKKSLPFKFRSNGVVNNFTNNYCLPADLENLDKCLYESKKILGLKRNWDGMKGDKITKKTWDGVVNFLTIYAKHIYSKFQRCIDIPKIYPSAAGSIDVDWETDNYGILINFAKGGRYATYYADDKNSQITEGSFDPLSFNVNLLPIAIS